MPLGHCGLGYMPLDHCGMYAGFSFNKMKIVLKEKLLRIACLYIMTTFRIMI